MAGAEPDPRTRASLLGRLARVPADPAAWAEFCDRYGTQVYRWGRRWGLQPADAEDIAQSVLLDVAKGIHEFRYDPTRGFRRWLKTVAHRAWCDWLTAHRRAEAGGADRLASVESRYDLLADLEQEHRREVFEAAALRVRLRVRPETWEAFRLVAVDGVPGPEAAARLGTTVGAVYVARCKVQKLLREEAAKLAPDD